MATKTERLQAGIAVAVEEGTLVCSAPPAEMALIGAIFSGAAPSVLEQRWADWAAEADGGRS